MATGSGLCEEVATGIPLAPELRESSGVVRSRAYPGVYWTHNDSGRGLWAVDANGATLATFRLPVDAFDWEDLALGPCAAGGDCLYALDVGDNYERRDLLWIVRVPEPDPSVGGGPLEGEAFHLRLPDGPRDIEAALLLPGETFLLVAKGRNHAQSVYRYPGPLRPDTPTVAEVQTLSDGPRIFPRQITGGSAAPGGRVAALRTYQALRLYRVEGDTLETSVESLVNLRTLSEPQGEGVALGADGELALTTEGGPGGGRGGLSLLRCDLDQL